ncbi:hypothetical protein [Roseobacter ponti]|uniref:Uncharacterized protein n=1 Tax=Roseobacter ponti TaxID=1891787 RepID=A0A858SYA2_9RHOB|nr:hypothetical protein [Roseobacter ponti]QJF53037.1 hypothetical protein G3256_18550 [Roseobacter ponti]
MQPSARSEWKETRLAGWGRALRVLVCGLFAIVALVLVVHPQTPVSGSWSARGILIVIIAVFCHKIAAAFYDRILWNDTGLRFAPVLGPVRCFDWADLTGVQTEMKGRATVLSFGRWRRLRLFWSYDGYREIADLAERKMEHA